MGIKTSVLNVSRRSLARSLSTAPYVRILFISFPRVAPSNTCYFVHCLRFVFPSDRDVKEILAVFFFSFLVLRCCGWLAGIAGRFKALSTRWCVRYTSLPYDTLAISHILPGMRPGMKWEVLYRQLGWISFYPCSINVYDSLFFLYLIIIFKNTCWKHFVVKLCWYFFSVVSALLWSECSDHRKIGWSVTMIISTPCFQKDVIGIHLG